jgi:RNA polymerase sigma factor for flagellar operon FliA
MTATHRLTAYEAESLWRAWKMTGDQQARDRLILSYAPMVKYLASKKVRELPTHCELDDLVSCGLLAVVEAVERFDPVKGATFEQYAWLRVSGAIVDELRRLDRVARSSRVVAREIEAVEDHWVATAGRKPNETELADELSMKVADLRATLGELDRAHVVSLSAPANRGTEAPVEIGETIAAPASDVDPEHALMLSERSEHFRAAMATLTDRERTVLALVHGQGVQGSEVGRMLGVTESRVSQILSSARRQLKQALDAYEAELPTAA